MATKAPNNEFYSLVALVVVDGPLKGKRFLLHDGKNVLGRAAECDVVLEDDGVSRQHAAVYVGEDVEVEDLGSASGTRHNDRMLVAKDFLFDNDEVRVGPFELRLEARKRESRSGVSFAISCLVVAIAFLGVAFALPDKPVVDTTRRSEEALKEGEASWENWSNISLPTVDDLRQENTPITAEAAWDHYRTGTRLYLDRYSDLRNPSRAIQQYKRALAIAGALPSADRPAFAHRATERMRELQKMILHECDRRVFVVRKHYKINWRGEAQRALEEITALTQWPDCRYFHWADQELRRMQARTRRT